MTALPPFDAILLDMDGLLLDSESIYCEAWRLAAAELGHRLEPDFLESLFGRHADDVVSALSAALGPAFRRDVFFRAAEAVWFRSVESAGISCMPGARELLSWMKVQHRPYAVATNSDGPYASYCLQQGGLVGEFPVVVTRDQVARGKPEPDVYLEAARRLGVRPQRCLVLEDSETGLQAARAARACPVLVQRRADLRASMQHLASFTFPSLHALLAMLESA